MPETLRGWDLVPNHFVEFYFTLNLSKWSHSKFPHQNPVPCLASWATCEKQRVHFLLIFKLFKLFLRLPVFLIFSTFSTRNENDRSSDTFDLIFPSIDTARLELYKANKKKLFVEYCDTYSYWTESKRLFYADKLRKIDMLSFYPGKHLYNKLGIVFCF